MNKVMIIGRLTRDPELKYTQSGKAVTTLSVAVDRAYSKDGKKEADFFPVVIWDKQAESTAQYVSKGKLIGIAGRLQTRNYEGQNGKVYVTEIVAEEVQFLEWADKAEYSPERSEYSKPTDFTDLQPVDEDDMPF